MVTSLSGLSSRDREYATAVARHLHFGRAAEACGVSQPVPGAQVRKLGLALFDRMPSGTRMTGPGADFIGGAVGLLTAARGPDRHEQQGGTDPARHHPHAGLLPAAARDPFDPPGFSAPAPAVHRCAHHGPDADAA